MDTTVIKTVIVILGILLTLASFGAQVATNEIDSRVSEDCEDAVGSIGEIIEPMKSSVRMLGI